MAIMQSANRLLHPEDEERRRRNEKVNAYLYNPFLKRDGTLANKYLDYQSIVDRAETSDKVRKLIGEATGVQRSTQTQNDKIDTVKTTGGTAQTIGNGKIGFISAKYETGGAGAGTISQSNGDYGGTSYGIPQFSTTTGSADNFVNWLKTANPTLGNYFGNAKAGTADFNNAWKKASADFGDTFGELQTQYAYNTFVQPLVNLAKEKTGVDYTRSPALTELIYSTAIQFGGGNLGLSALGNVNANMSDTDIINASYDNKISNYKNYFRSSSADIQESVKNRFANERNDILSLLGSSYTSGSGVSGNVGRKVANTNLYNNDAATGQCVWYVRGRMKEKLGKDVGAIGNANQMWYNAKADARLGASVENIKPNTLATYKTGTSAAGQSAGHVIYIEDVIGDTVYYTEGGSGYHKNGTDGVVKTASKQGILNGINSNGSRFGSGLIGFIDLNKY